VGTFVEYATTDSDLSLVINNHHDICRSEVMPHKIYT